MGASEKIFKHGNKYKMIEKKPFLSICIPTYNRYRKLYELLMNVLQSPIECMEIVVVDNCSDDNTFEILDQIKDSRLKAYKNKTNIGAIPNLFKALSFAQGVYSILCLDTGDKFEMSNMPELISVLKNNENIVLGFCEPDLKFPAKEPVKYYARGAAGVKKTAYMSKHPSGYFFKTEKLHNLELFKKLLADENKFDFCLQLVCAELVCMGESCSIDFPLLIRSSDEDAILFKTKTYTSKNIFFSPKQRMKEYGLYMEHLYTLNIPTSEKKIILKRLFRNGLVAATIGYREALRREVVRQHYNLEYKKIIALNFITTDLKYCIKFIQLNIPVNYCYRIGVCIQEHLLYLIRKCILKFSKNEV
jgi:glycosyltransferase involved in cell wall biosynthesis